MPDIETYIDPVAVVIATTGPDPYRDRITAIAAVTHASSAGSDSFQQTAEAESDVAAMIEAFRTHMGERLTCVAHDADRASAFLRRATKERLKLKILGARDLARICYPSLPSYGLHELCDHLELQISPNDSPIDTCMDTMRLWDRLIAQLQQLPPQLVAELERLFSASRGDPMAQLFRAVMKGGAEHADPHARVADLFRKETPPRRRQLPETARQPLDADGVADIFGPAGPFAARIEGYECRPQQADMARAVATAFNESHHLVVEAGTGVGKSLAYLAPVTLWASTNKMPVVVSTNTKNLQSQLIENDLPLLQDILGRDIHAVIIKGRNNYLCVRKFCYLLRHTDFELSRKERVSLASVAAWATNSVTGDIAECSACGSSASSDLSDRVTSDVSECHGPNCRHRQQCFLFRARRKAKAADVVIANHAIVFREMEDGDDSPVLPPYRHLVLDEAHNMEGAATAWLSTEISTARLYYLLGRLWRSGRRKSGSGSIPTISHHLGKKKASNDPELAKLARRHVDAIIAEIGAITPVVDEFFNSLGALLAGGDRRDCVRVRADSKRESQWRPIMDAKKGLVASLSTVMRSTEALMQALQQMEGAGPIERADFIQDLQGATERLSTFTEDIDFVLAADSEEYVYWVESQATRDGGIRAWSAPIRIGQLLLEHLYSKKESVILTSATLSVGGSLEFMKKRIGLDLLDKTRLVEMNAGTPFDYRRQCAVMVPLFLPDPAEPGGDYITQLGILLAEVFRRTRGRGMALFTSYDMLKKTSAILRDEMATDAVQILTQGESGSRENIIKTFKKDLGSVLMGTHSFWEGVDVVGESLSCLAVARLPFAVFTDPVVAARCEQVEAEGQNAFMGFSLPNAIIRFRQGFGRLIRHKTDRGIVIVTDRRLVARRYGHWFQKSLPTPTLTFPDRDEFLDAVEDFIQQADKGA